MSALRRAGVVLTVLVVAAAVALVWLVRGLLALHEGHDVWPRREQRRSRRDVGDGADEMPMSPMNVRVGSVRSSGMSLTRRSSCSIVVVQVQSRWPAVPTTATQ